MSFNRKKYDKDCYIKQVKTDDSVRDYIINTPENNCKNCYWKLTGNIRASVGGNVNVSMYCNQCNIKEEVFLTESEYRIHEKILLREVTDGISAS